MGGLSDQVSLLDKVAGLIFVTGSGVGGIAFSPRTAGSDGTLSELALGMSHPSEDL